MSASMDFLSQTVNRLRWKVCGREIMLHPQSLIMGILNVTPDSFWDGGQYLDPIAAIDRAQQMVEEGAGMIDIGAESSRPGSLPIGKEEEMQRVMPVLEKVGKCLTVPISIDTTKSEIAKRALDLGASVINDVSALQDDLSLADVVAAEKAGLVLMHRQGTSQTMQDNPQYQDIIESIQAFLQKQMGQAEQAGISQDQILLDPGIGFGKTVDHNLAILARLGELATVGRPLMIGVSRKVFIGKVLDVEKEHRLMGTVAAVLVALWHGARVFRVHDVQEVRQAVRMAEAIVDARVLTPQPE